MRRCLASLIAVAILVGPALSSADPRKMTATARRELTRGLGLFEAHDYAGAISAFDAGYALDPHPDFLYAKAQAQRIGGDCRGAIASYEAFLATTPPDREAARARSNVARCTQLLAASRPAAEEPPEAAAPARSPDADATRVASAGGEQPLRVDAGGRRAWWTDRPGLVLAGTGIVGLLTGATFAWFARGNVSDAQETITIDQWRALQVAHDRNRLGAGIATGLGAALVVAAGVRFVWVSRRVTATVSRDAAVVGIGGAW